MNLRMTGQIGVPCGSAQALDHCWGWFLVLSIGAVRSFLKELSSVVDGNQAVYEHSTSGT